MRHIVLALSLAVVPTSAAAQVVEVGATMAAGCLGSDGSLCGAGTYPTPGVHASWWIADRLEVGARVSRLASPAFQGSTAYPRAVTFDVTDRSRAFVSALATYHFRRSKSVRPFLGLGSGGYARSQRMRCEPAGCGAVPGLPPEGLQRTWMQDQIVAVGMAVHVGNGWVARGGFLCHRFANDENSAIETFAGVGYRFGARRE